MTQTTAQHNDHRVKDAVAGELAWTSAVNADQVGVSVNDGVVTLSGEVDSYLVRTAAVAAALRVTGVTSVVDEITVRSPTGRTISASPPTRNTLSTRASHSRTPCERRFATVMSCCPGRFRGTTNATWPDA